VREWAREWALEWALASELAPGPGPGPVVEMCKLVRTEYRWESVWERPMNGHEDRERSRVLEDDASNPDRCRARQGEPWDSHEALEGSTRGVLLHLPFDMGRARTGQDYRTGPIVLQPAHCLSEHRRRSLEQTNSWLGSQFVDYQP